MNHFSHETIREDFPGITATTFIPSPPREVSADERRFFPAFLLIRHPGYGWKREAASSHAGHGSDLPDRNGQRGLIVAPPIRKDNF
jgi:hypothetical protein